jgi:ABC-type nitrate/sulfonate/bicarbonate transport system permease component
LLFMCAFGLAGGAILARRFSVFVLLPAILFAVPTTIVAEFVSGHQFTHSLLAALSVAIGLQLGFALGAFLGVAGAKRQIANLVRPLASNRLDGR